jgi:1-acyl-sn-glycerol-3-phosphate acyltransferase
MSQFHQVALRAGQKVDKYFGFTFSSITIDGPELDAAGLQRNPLMFVSTHRSHLDYFLLGATLLKRGFQNLRFAAGDNLTNLPYVGRKFRSWGAFAVARDTGFERNYVRNLCNSVIGMLEQSESIIVFPEGGRSYSGSTMEIRSGILAAAIITQARDMSKNVSFIPFAITYECPPDVPWFEMLQKGKRLRKKTNSFYKRALGNILYFGADLLAFIPFLLAKKFGRRYGAAYVDYDVPVLLKDIVDIPANRIENARDEFSSHRVSMQLVSEYFHKKFLSLIRVLPVNVVAAAIEKDGLSLDDIKGKIGAIVDTLRKNSRNTRELDSMDAGSILEKGINQLVKLKVLLLKDGTVKILKPLLVQYFAATINDSENKDAF